MNTIQDVAKRAAESAWASLADRDVVHRVAAAVALAVLQRKRDAMGNRADMLAGRGKPEAFAALETELRELDAEIKAFGSAVETPQTTAAAWNCPTCGAMNYKDGAPWCWRCKKLPIESAAPPVPPAQTTGAEATAFPPRCAARNQANDRCQWGEGHTRPHRSYSNIEWPVAAPPVPPAPTAPETAQCGVQHWDGHVCSLPAGHSGEHMVIKGDAVVTARWAFVSSPEIIEPPHGWDCNCLPCAVFDRMQRYPQYATREARVNGLREVLALGMVACDVDAQAPEETEGLRKLVMMLPMVLADLSSPSPGAVETPTVTETQAKAERRVALKLGFLEGFRVANSGSAEAAWEDSEIRKGFDGESGGGR